MSLDENNLEVRLLEVERRLGWMADAFRALQRQQAGTDQQVAMAWTQMGFIQSPSTLGNLSPATSGSGVSARAGSTPGSGTITLQSGNPLEDGASVTCYNALTAAVAASKNMVVGQDAEGNYWVVTAECA